MRTATKHPYRGTMKANWAQSDPEPDTPYLKKLKSITVGTGIKCQYSGAKAKATADGGLLIPTYDAGEPMKQPKGWMKLEAWELAKLKGETPTRACGHKMKLAAVTATFIPIDKLVEKRKRSGLERSFAA